ncbi:MAG: GntR family transcriptional regulator [Bacteroidetes bacterium]|nr:GntR family transcriptional regulator [Bacteroidota bacterium]MCB0841649.1 GntR family transcriptional regulator [Bacteroidota bacterium]MCB0851833.1 GntR family transcriptional regulator [Bacteroidota bacterium]
MVNPGEDHILKIVEVHPDHLMLADELEENRIMLPINQKSNTFSEGEHLNVFVYQNAQGDLIATTQQPKIKLYQFGYLKVAQVTEHGAFLDWGLDKDIFVPFREQREPMVEGRKYLVHLYLDHKSNRLVASSKINKFLDNSNLELVPGEEVDIIIGKGTDLGINVIINHRYKGLIYYNEIFRKINTGDQTTGYVKNIREGNKVDISLDKQGYENIEPNAARILHILKQEDGFLPLNDKSSPEEIQDTLEMSKKTFKKSIGALYKQRLIRIEPGGIFLNEE